MQEKLGKTYEVLIEGISKKSEQYLYGRTTYNSAVVFEKGNHKLGDYVMVKINDCTSATLKGTVI
jgi:tRNA-2-methylthio-N6-dimethylallyladenosine synthase